MKIIEIPKQQMQEGDEKGFAMVELRDDGKIGRLTPHCKVHGAMNKFSNGIWRCLTQYGYKKIKEDELPRFMDRVCPACCLEVLK